MTLIPMAPNMTTLLASLKDMPFTCEHDTIQPELRATTDRSEALSTLMSILIEQSTNDGFRLITINTEPKRVIMACNRQGKPPNWKQNQDSSSETEDGDDDPDKKKRSGRWGTSIRCQCRMRVNINYHTKINAWRVTSYEANHNHGYGKYTRDEAEELKIDPEFRLNENMILQAINKYREMNSPPPRLRVGSFHRDSDAALVLTSLAKSPFEATSPTTTGRHSFPATNKTSPINAQPDPHQLPIPSFTPGQSSNTPQRPPRIIVVRRSNNTGPNTAPHSPISTGMYSAGGLISPVHPKPSMLQFRQPMAPAPVIRRRNSISMSPTSASPHHQPKFQSSMKPPDNNIQSLKGLAATAIEIDRYAMLHNQFKKLIAVACKKREHAEEVLGMIGMMTERLSPGTVKLTKKNDVKLEAEPSHKRVRLAPPEEEQVRPEQETTSTPTLTTDESPMDVDKPSASESSAPEMQVEIEQLNEEPKKPEFAEQTTKPDEPETHNAPKKLPADINSKQSDHMPRTPLPAKFAHRERAM